MSPEKLPIGYWIRKAYVMLTNEIDKIHKKLGITQTVWQILNTVYNYNIIHFNEIRKLMADFANESILKQIIEHDFKHCFIITDNNISLSDKGNELFGKCVDKQLALREKSMKGMTFSDYDITVRSLKIISENLSKQIKKK